MPTYKKEKTNFSGVYARQSSNPDRKHRGKPDVAYYISYRDSSKKLIHKCVGWASEGSSPKHAYNERIRLQADSAKQPTVMQPTDKSGATLAAPNYTLHDVALKYFCWRETEGKYTSTDQCRYEVHTKELIGGLYLKDIRRVVANDFKQQLLAKGLSASNSKKVLSAVRSILNYASRMDMWEGKNPFNRESGFKMPRVNDQSERFLSAAECDLLLEKLCAKSLQLHDMVALSLHTGLRASEIVRIRGSDVDIKAECIWIAAKGGYRQRTKTPKIILSMLAKYGRKENELIFQDRKGKQIRKISSTFYRLTRELGINTPDTPPEKRVRFHTLRHTFASALAQSGKFTLLEVKDLMRHKTIAMTERYGHLVPDEAWAKTETALSSYFGQATKPE